MSLTARQKRFYRRRCDIITVSVASNTDGFGTAGEDSYEVIARDVPHMQQTTENITLKTTVGRFLEANLDTREIAHFDPAQLVPEQSLLRLTAPASLAGQIFRVLGPARVLTFRANVAEYDVRLETSPPSNLPD